MKIYGVCGWLMSSTFSLCCCTGTSVQEEQLKCHESKLKQISLEVEEHKRNPPELTPKSKESEEYRIKEHYLTYEVSSMLKPLLIPIILCF